MHRNLSVALSLLQVEVRREMKASVETSFHLVVPQWKPCGSIQCINCSSGSKIKPDCKVKGALMSTFTNHYMAYFHHVTGSSAVLCH